MAPGKTRGVAAAAGAGFVLFLIASGASDMPGVRIVCGTGAILLTLPQLINWFLYGLNAPESSSTDCDRAQGITGPLVRPLAISGPSPNAGQGKIGGRRRPSPRRAGGDAAAPRALPAGRQHQ